MPKMSMTMTEGEVVGWTVAAGADVRVGDTVCEVLTDKVDMEVESPVSGRLVRIDVEEGTAQVGEPIGWIETEDDDALAGLFDEPESPRAAGTQPASGVPLEPTPGRFAEPAHRGPVPAVPRARALARQHQIDLTTLHGSGPGGRVLVADVEARTASLALESAKPGSTLATSPTRSRRAEAVRTALTRTMTASAAVPQFTVWRDLDLEPADAVRGSVSWTTVLLQAYAAALRQVPALLTKWDGGRACPVEQVRVALAVDTPDGLLVPTFADPDLISAARLDADVRATVASARRGRIDATHLLPAVATLSNLGGLGVDRFHALVTPPQASVLATGTVDRRPVAVAGGLGLGLRVTVGLSVDHRVADGADGARLLMAVAAAVAEGSAR